MRELVIDGKKYVKAKDIAKDLGYTSDYVGQLCRAGKVEAKQIGRNWYVNPDTIREHQKRRYRSNQAKSKAALETYKSSVLSRQSTSAHARYVAVNHYEPDETDLLPVLQNKKTDKTLAADLSTAPIKINIQTTSPDKHTFKPDERPKIKFSGDVRIQADDGNAATTAASRQSFVARSKIRHSVDQISHPAAHKFKNSSRRISVSPMTAEQHPQAVSVVAVKSKSGYGWCIKLLFTTILIIAGFVVISGIEKEWDYQNGTTDTNYRFNSEKFLNLLYKI